MAPEPKLEIYLDGSCALCQWSRAHIEPWDTRRRLRFLDYNGPDVAAKLPYSHEELGREMHLRASDGTWTAGFAAWVRILRVLPGLAWLGWLLNVPPMRWIGPSVYRWVAHHRKLLPGVPAQCAPNAGTRKNSPSGRRAI